MTWCHRSVCRYRAVVPSRRYRDRPPLAGVTTQSSDKHLHHQILRKISLTAQIEIGLGEQRNCSLGPATTQFAELIKRLTSRKAGLNAERVGNGGLASWHQPHPI